MLTKKATDMLDTVLREYTGASKLFTSVDITNEVKRRGIWASNSSVARFLRNSFYYEGYHFYNQQAINVNLDSGVVLANVYYPPGEHASNYDGRGQTAIKPEEFKQIKVKLLEVDMEIAIDALSAMVEEKKELEKVDPVVLIGGSRA